MKHVKTIALCAVVALGVGATSATAGSLITGAKIKNGTVAMRDLTPGVQKMIKERPINGLNGATGATGEKGANGMKGADGANGVKGKDGVRYDRLTGTGTPETAKGTAALAGGVMRLGVPHQNAWAQVVAYPKDVTLADLDQLSFRNNSTDAGIAWLKINVEGGSVMYSPNTQDGGERGLGKWANHDVLAGSVRWNDDKGALNKDMKWEDLLAIAGRRQVADVRMSAGYANPVGTEGGVVQVDDVTINDEVIDFN